MTEAPEFPAEFYELGYIGIDKPGNYASTYYVQGQFLLITLSFRHSGHKRAFLCGLGEVV